MYYFQLVDSYCATTSALIIGLTEVLAVFWVYGIDKYMNHIKEMIGSYPTPNIYWKVIWKFICPLIIGVNNHFNRFCTSHKSFNFSDPSNDIICI